MAQATYFWFLEGQQAFRSGIDIEDCPYDVGTESYNMWCDGWYTEAEAFND